MWLRCTSWRSDVRGARGGRASRAGAPRAGCSAGTAIDGALVLRPCRQVHTIGMRFPIDVAFCAADGTRAATS